MLDRQRAAGRRPVVRRDLVRRRDRLHLRRPGGAADRRGLPQVLRLAVRGADHRAHAGHDGDRRADRGRDLQRAGAHPPRPPQPGRRVRVRPGRLQAVPGRRRAGALRGAHAA